VACSWVAGAMARERRLLRIVAIFLMPELCGSGEKSTIAALVARKRFAEETKD